MKSIYLLRHAKSSWKYPDLSDFERPLNKRGRTDAPKIGEFLEEKGQVPEEVVCSPANRAVTTARLVCSSFGFSNEKIRPLSSLYTFGNTQAAENEIFSMPDEMGSLMIVGHNEWISELANALCVESVGHMVTCAVVKLNFAVDKWTEVKQTSGDLEFHVFPKMLEQ